MKKITALLLAVVLAMATAVPAFAVGFTPSVESKPAPTVVLDGSNAAIIYDKDGNKVTDVPNGDLNVTPVSGAETTSYDQIKQRLNRAYETLKNTSDLSTLVPDLMNVVGNVAKEDLVVRDLFDVCVVGSYADKLAEEGSYVEITLKISDINALKAVLFSQDGEEWGIVKSSNITKNSDGTVTIRIYSEGVLAFVYDGGKLSIDPNGPDAQQTSDPTGSIMGWIVAAGATILAVVGITKKRQSFGKY